MIFKVARIKENYVGEDMSIRCDVRDLQECCADHEERIEALESEMPDPIQDVITHDWSLDSWGDFEPITITEDGDQEFDLSVVNGKGHIQGDSSGGNLRVAYTHLGTDGWLDSEIRSVIWGPTEPWVGNNAQQGHIHRVREVSPGNYEGIAFWTSVVFGANYSFIHVNAIRFDGTTLLQGDGSEVNAGTSDSDWIDRDVMIEGRDHINAFTATRVRYTPRSNFQYVTNEDTVSTIDMDDSDLNVEDADVATNDISRGQIAIINNEPNGDIPWSIAQWDSRVRPTGGSLNKRWVPYVLATRVRGGSSSEIPVEYKRWRLEDPEPDWGDPRVRRGTVQTNDNIPDLPVEGGRCALWGAHFYDGSGGEFGDITFTNLTDE